MLINFSLEKRFKQCRQEVQESSLEQSRFKAAIDQCEHSTIRSNSRNRRCSRLFAVGYILKVSVYLLLFWSFHHLWLNDWMIE